MNMPWNFPGDVIELIRVELKASLHTSEHISWDASTFMIRVLTMTSCQHRLVKLVCRLEIKTVGTLQAVLNNMISV